MSRMCGWIQAYVFEQRNTVWRVQVTLLYILRVSSELVAAVGGNGGRAVCIVRWRQRSG